MKVSFYFSLLLIFTQTLNASYYDDVRLGDPEYGGTGCPAGSAAVALSPDAQSLSILFDSFVVQAGGDFDSVGRKNCNLAVPVHVPAGYSVSIFQIDYRGFNYLPIGASSRFSVEYFFAGTRGPVYNKTFNGYLNENYLIGNSLVGSAISWSECGDSVTLRANTSMMVNNRNRQESAMSTVDSVDIDAGIYFRLNWRPCSN